MCTRSLNNNLNKLTQQFCVSLFLIFSLSGNAQKNWEGLNIGDIGPIAYFNHLAVDTLEDKLVLGGSGHLTQINGVSACPVIKWTPENGVEILHPSDHNAFSVIWVQDILFSNDSMIIVGDFGVSIFKNGNIILNGNYPSVVIHSIIPYHGKYLLAFLGNTTLFQGEPMQYLAQWDGDTTFSEFENISSQINHGGAVYSVADFQGDVYVGGNIRTTNGGLMNNVMRWNGTNWNDMDGGITNIASLGGVNELIEYQGDLYVAGMFYQNDHSKENLITRWDGQSWKTVGGGFGWGSGPGTEVINAMHVHNGYLYVSGQFETAGGVPVNSIARWDGSQWCGNGSTFNAQVVTMTHYRDTLYVAGGFNKIDGDSIHRVARFIGDNFADTCGSLATAINGLLPEPVFLNGYPNPAINTFTVNLPFNQTQDVQMVVYNNMGQVVIPTQHFTTKSQLSFDVSMLSKGNYISRISAGDEMYIVSFIKE